MKLKTIFLILILYFSLLGGKVPYAKAVVLPGFPICSNPQGTLKVEYNDGTHGIVGDTSEYKGSDKVYTLSDSTLLQCFCAADGNGIQTNWWKVSDLTSEEIEILKRQGWYYVANGALWGLEETAYMAFNSSYSCKESGGVGGPEGSVLGASTSALAGTGDTIILYTLAGIGLASLLLAFVSKRHEK